MKRRSEVGVGILITSAVVVLILGALWLARGGLKAGYPLYTRFAWGQNLKQGQPVLLAGVSVGYVGDVNLRRDGYLDVMLRIDDQYQIPKGSKSTVQAVGIFGDVAVALTPPKPVPTVSYAPGDTVPPGPPSADVNEIMSRVDSMEQTTSILLTALKTEVVQAGTLNDIHRIMASTATLAAQLQGVVAEQDKNVSETIAQFRAEEARLGRMVDSADVAASIASLRATSANAAHLSASLDSTNTALRDLLVQAKSQNGTVGKLLGDTAMYSNFTRLMAHADSLIQDFQKNPKKYINVRIF
jgi:phospholipid/cholesterol/gamma-HCH transport system substrate-binding protein